MTASLRTSVARPDLAGSRPRSLSDARIFKHDVPGRGNAVAIRTPPVPRAAASVAAGSAEVTLRRAEDQDRIAQGLNGVVVRRLFAAGLDLEIALGLIDDDRASSEVCRAIDELDEAIKDIRDVVFGSRLS